MSFEKTFCPSPWFHMRINNAGEYEYCRWASKENRNSGPALQNMQPAEYFQKHMSAVRSNMLDGVAVDQCGECQQMEKHGKVSGRQKQLLKVGIQSDNFKKTLLSSPWFDHFRRTTINLLPQDWQIDLGNFCNSGCVFCSPESSSKLAAEFKKLNIIQQLPNSNWTADPVQLQRFIDTVKQSPTIKYLHFIGGETLITPAFETILRELIASGINQTCSIGFTTNLHCWNQPVVDLLTQFQEVNLGVSVECLDSLNDYVRWPSNIDSVKTTLDRWMEIATQHSWLVQMRTTPTWLTIGRLLSVYDYAWQQGVAVESCNFLQEPNHLRISVLPEQYRQPILERMQQWTQTHKVDGDNTIYNIRNPQTAKLQILQDLSSYIDYLKNSKYENELLPSSVQYLKQLESHRNNSVLSYLPEYEQLLKSAGY
jgi:sulfatase maturation enzyme AslB (radical SAM superfamily)